MRILYIAAECKPFSKAGGVGDVAGELPVALHEQGVKIEIATPLYDSTKPSLVGNAEPPSYDIHPNGAAEKVEWFAAEVGGVPVHLARNRQFGSEVYITSRVPFLDDALRFSLFSEACLELIARINPDVVHINDWVLGYLFGRMAMLGLRQYKVLTVHNISYQGNIGIDALPADSVIVDLLKFHGDRFLDPHREWHSVNPLRLALELADRANAVSPTYAKEITEPQDDMRYFEGGKGLDGVAARLHSDGKLIGILNGFRYRFEPTRERFADVLANKSQAKALLGARFARPEAFLLGFVGRAVEQKFKLLTEDLEGRPVLEHILQMSDVNVAVLASGLPEYHEFLARYVGRPNFSVEFRFDPAMAEQISLGCDVFLMPSLFEPCGITQMESLSNATPPLVRKTGGLADTVIAHTEWDGTGFVFDGATKREVLSRLIDALKAAHRLYAEGKDEFREIQWNGFQKRFRWTDSAQRYISDLYAPAIEMRGSSEAGRTV